MLIDIEFLILVKLGQPGEYPCKEIISDTYFGDMFIFCLVQFEKKKDWKLERYYRK